MISGWRTRILQTAWRSPQKRKIRGGCGALRLHVVLAALASLRGRVPGEGANWKWHRMWRPPGRVTTAHPRWGEEHVDRPSRAHVVLGSRDHLGERTGNAALPGPIQDGYQVGLLSYIAFFGWINNVCYRRDPTSFIFPSVLCSLQDLSSLTREQTRIPCRESTQS